MDGIMGKKKEKRSIFIFFKKTDGPIAYAIYIVRVVFRVRLPVRFISDQMLIETLVVGIVA